MKLTIYTALFADETLPIEEVGNFYPFKHDKDDVRYIAYTNREDLTSNYWEVRKIDVKEGLSPRMMSREIKWNPTIYLEDFTHSLWLDSQCYFSYEPKAIVNHYKINRFPNGSYYIVNDEFLNVYLWSVQKISLPLLMIDN